MTAPDLETHDGPTTLETKFEGNPSSLLLSAKYHTINEALTLKFKSNPETAYTFFDVPETVARGLMEASSPGSYFHSRIKSKYTFSIKQDKIVAKGNDTAVTTSSASNKAESLSQTVSPSHKDAR